MSIRNIERFIAALWDWGFLDGCFGTTGSRVGDVDGILGHCGEILLLEGKPLKCAPEIGERWGNGSKQNNGQARLWRELAGRGITVLVLWGDAKNTDQPMIKMPQRMQMWRRFQQEPDEVKAASVEVVRRVVKLWWTWAEKTNQEAAE